MLSFALPSRFVRIFVLLCITLFVLGTIFTIDKNKYNTFLDKNGRVLGYESIHIPEKWADAWRDREPAAPPNPHSSQVEPHQIVPVMDKLTNETAKALLGTATWKYLHTLTLRFPLSPSSGERKALEDYFWLTGRLYPCGDCAKHFLALLEKYPPQTSGRKSASEWLCFIHNQVNDRLGKEQYDCSALGGDYDCGCGSGDNSTSTVSDLQLQSSSSADSTKSTAIVSDTTIKSHTSTSDSYTTTKNSSPFDEALGVELMRGGKRRSDN